MSKLDQEITAFEGDFFPEIPEDLDRAEAAMLRQPQVDCPIAHHFLPGIYVRQMSAPAGTLLLGMAHKEEHGCLLLQGKLRFRNENGTYSELTAPCLFTGRAGRKAALALTDVVFCNLHATDEKDVTKLEEKYVTKSQARLEYEQKQQLQESER